MSRSRKRPYRKSRRFDATCRNHGSCPWCARNRVYGSTWRELMADDALQEYHWICALHEVTPHIWHSPHGSAEQPLLAGWYFVDETADFNGPYPTEADANRAFGEYCDAMTPLTEG